MLLLLLLLLLLGMSAGEIAISDDPRAQKIYEGFRMCASPLSLSPAPPLSPLVPLRSLSFLRAPPPVCRIAPGVLVRVSPGRGALPTLAATHANNLCHTLPPRSDAINMRDATTGSLVWESDSVWCVAIIAV